MPSFDEDGPTIEEALPYGDVIGYVLVFVLLPIPVAIIHPILAVLALFGIGALAAFTSEDVRVTFHGAVVAGGVWFVLLAAFVKVFSLGRAGLSGPAIWTLVLTGMMLGGVAIGAFVGRYYTPEDLDELAEKYGE